MMQILKGNSTKYHKTLEHEQNHVPGKSLTVFWNVIKYEAQLTVQG